MFKLLNTIEEYTENQLQQFSLEDLNTLHYNVSQQWIGSAKAFEGLTLLKQVGALDADDAFSKELEEFCQKKFTYLNTISIVLFQKQNRGY